MNLQSGVLAVVLGAVGLLGCSNHDDVIASKDEALNERSAENEALKRRVADAESVKLAYERSMQMKDQELVRAREEQARVASEASRTPSTDAEMVNSGSRESSGSVESPRPNIQVNDPDIEVESRASGDVVMRLNAKELFTPGSADLSPAGQRVLTKVADTVRRYPDLRLSVEGHTDDTPLKKTAARWKNNLNLSIARAISVRKYLNERGSVDDDRMRVVGYGDTRPLVPNKDETSRSKNRRVEIVLYK